MNSLPNFLSETNKVHHTGPWASTRLHIKQVHYLQQTGHTNSKRLCTFHDGRKLKAKMKKGNTNLWRRGDTVKVRSQLGHDLSEVYIVRVRNWGSTGTTFDGLQLTFAMWHMHNLSDGTRQWSESRIESLVDKCLKGNERANDNGFPL